MDTLFDSLLAEVNRLHAHPDWLPIERSQVSFYSQQLSSLSNSYQILKITDHPGFLCLHILVSRILEYKNVRQASVDYFNDPDPPDLSLVGDQLAFEVSQIFDISMKDFSKASPECASKYFHFDRNKYQEQVDGDVFVGFHVEASNLLKQLASFTRRKLEVISIVGMAGLGKTTLATRLYNDSYVVSYFYVRSWITISQVYHKRDLLLDMLRSIVEITDEICVMNDNMLAHLLYRALMGRRFLIVIDDIWSKGFIHPDGTNTSLEDVAKDYLMDLISRCLVVVGKKGLNGSIRTCRIHDLLRDMCLRKAEEINILSNMYKYNKHSFSCSHSSTSSSTKSQLSLSTNGILTILPSCSCYSSEVSRTFFKDVSITWDTSKLIRSLDISSIELFVFPVELLQLVHLRYLELRFRSGNPPEFISDLRELQTLIMSSRMNMVIPKNMWKMIRLRHLCIKSGENIVNFSSLEEDPCLLENLQTMSLVSPVRPCQHILSRTRSLRKLGLCGPFITKSGDLKFPDLGLLMHLKTLKLLNTIPLCKAGRLSDSIIFPESLRSLSLSNTYLDWREGWAFEMIPNLEVLKLKFHAFVGQNWETSLEAFPRLKFLKLEGLDIVHWTASRNHFPVLQRLQVYRCSCLMEIPEDFGSICTLEWLELSGCSDAATNSAIEIQKYQMSIGNDWLKILLNPGLSKQMHKGQTGQFSEHF
ncbi:NB-ARC domain-containing protein [Heracleum sosnowskyi]|uniref:NB-ARC domain-containing protein n=1 Tax=Heracleum sosnowskyi TaxID=360622 RepID=A0AAD8H023_9APIA|nr:NB-ARC domain-containing protein [Heracleum sosnowskyi]